MAKKQHLSRIDTTMTMDIEKLRMEASQPSGDLPTMAAVNESVERLTQLPKRIKKEKEIGEERIKNPKIPKLGIERGRDAKGKLNRVGITALIDSDLLSRVKIFAITNGVSMSDVMNDALAKYLSI
jgi:hypothetical protein